MGPTYLVLLLDAPGEFRAGDRPTVLYRGLDETEARNMYDYACKRGLVNATVYLATVRAEAKLS